MKLNKIVFVFRLEFEAEGRCHILSVYENLELVSKEDWEATLPKEKLDDKSNVAEAEAAATPAVEQPLTGAGATPKSAFGGRFKKKRSRFGATPNKPSSKPCSDAEATKVRIHQSTVLFEIRFWLIFIFLTKSAP